MHDAVVGRKVLVFSENRRHFAESPRRVPSMNLGKPTIVFALLLAMTGGLAHAGLVPGQMDNGGLTSLASPDPFRLTFDEKGNGFYQIFNEATGQYGPAINDPGVVDPLTGFLTYRLPMFVVPGAVLISGGVNDPADSTLSGFSDRIFFFDDATSGLMQYMSFRGPGEVGDLADVTTFPIDTTLVVTETGLEGDNSFTYPNGGDPAAANIFVGVSDGSINAVPEPSTITHLAIGTAFLALGGWVQRQRSRADSRKIASRRWPESVPKLQGATPAP
jgi:hypothetical protein